MLNFSSFPTAHWAEFNAQRAAVVWEKGNDQYFPFLKARLSWAEFHALVEQTAQLLSADGVGAQNFVAYSGTHRLAGLLCYCAAIALGARILMLNPALSESQRQTVLTDNGIEICITDHLFAKFREKTTAYQFPVLEQTRPATLTLTSGSAGKPKAVVHTLQNHLQNARGVCELMRFGQDNSWLLSLPLYHVSGQGIVWRWLLQGATLYVHESKERFFDFLTQVSHASLVPTQLARYWRFRETSQARLSSPRQRFLLGGSFIPPDLLVRAQAENIITYSGYGMTETASTICAGENETDNAGKPLEGREVKIVDGEIWVKGAGLALGYLQKNHKIRPLVNRYGWFQTKDRGEWNAEGKLVVKGRLDNMFISGGENIQPEEIEKLIFSSGMVEQVFVLPKDDPEFGRRPIALVVFKSADFAKNVKILTAWLSDKLEKFKWPIEYLPLAALKYPQQGAIKISRAKLEQILVKN